MHQIYVFTITHISVVLSAIAAMAKAYPYQEEGYRGGDIFGEAGLNAVSLSSYLEFLLVGMNRNRIRCGFLPRYPG